MRGMKKIRTLPVESLETRWLLSTYPLSSVPLLNSDPGAKAEIYLDFQGTSKITTWGSYSVPATPAYDTDGDPTTFSDAELANIQQIWARVAEKFSPFNINVTTVDPGTLTPGVDMRAVIGGAGTWTGGTYGGYSYIGSFTTSNNTSWIFSSNLGSGDPHYTAEAIAHEAGHEFGLQHQSTWSGTTLTAVYSTGNSYEAPIMGDSYYAARGTWWDGTSQLGYNTIQDDMGVISSSTNGFGYRPQDHGQSLGSADALSVAGDGTVSASGIIEKTSDTDFFTFVTGSGTLTLNGNVAQYGATLDLKLVLLDANGTVIASAASATQLNESVTATVPAGTYYLEVASYGNYGDVGQYTVSGSVVPQTNYVAPPSNLTASVGATGQVALNWSESSSGISGFDLQRSSDGGNAWVDLSQLPATTMSYTDTATSPGASYAYRVYAVASTGNSAMSNVVTAVVPPATPTGLTATAVSSSQIALSWSAGAGDASYLVQRSLDGVNWINVVTTTATSFQDSGLFSGTTYYYQVCAQPAATTSVTSPPTAPVSAATLVAMVPNAPTNLLATALGKGKIKLTWTASSTDQTSFLVQDSTDGQTWKQLASVSATTTSYQCGGFKRGKVYYFRVFAVNAAGTSVASNTASVTAAALGIDADGSLPVRRRDARRIAKLYARELLRML